MSESPHNHLCRNQKIGSSVARSFLLGKLVVFSALLICLSLAIPLSPTGLRVVAGQTQGDSTSVTEYDQAVEQDEEEDDDPFFKLPVEEQRRLILDMRAKRWHALDFTNPEEQILKITIRPVAGNFEFDDLKAFVEKPIVCRDKEILGRLKLWGYQFSKFSGMTCYVDTSDGTQNGWGVVGCETVVAFVSIETNLRTVDITLGIIGFQVGKATGIDINTRFYRYYLSRIMDDVVFKETGMHLSEKYLDRLSGQYEIEMQKERYEEIARENPKK